MRKQLDGMIQFKWRPRPPANNVYMDSKFMVRFSTLFTFITFISALISSISGGRCSVIMGH